MPPGEPGKQTGRPGKETVTERNGRNSPGGNTPSFSSIYYLRKQSKQIGITVEQEAFINFGNARRYTLSTAIRTS